jgi:hypothetical protein
VVFLVNNLIKSGFWDKRKASFHFALCGIFILLSSICDSRADSAKPFAVKGHLSVWDVFNQTNHLSYELDFLVNVDRGTRTWRLDDLSRPPRAAFTFEDFVLDRELADPPITLPQIAATPFYDGGYPVDLEQDQRTIWMAYCATDFLKKHNGENVILPDQDARLSIRIYGCRAFTKWRSSEDVCPESIDFIFSKDLLTNADATLKFEAPGAMLDWRADEMARYLSWATNGMLRARFQVLEWTNFAAQTIPANWKISYFEEGGLLARQFEARITSVVLGENPIQLPVPPVMRLADLRVRQIGRLNELGYNVTNGAILPLNNPKVVKLVSRISQSPVQTMPSNLSRPRTVIFTVFALLLVAPLLIAGIRRYLHTKSS